MKVNNMIDKISKKTIIEKEISVTEEVSNAITGNKNYLINRLKTSIKNAKSIDIIVSFLMESGVKMLLNDLKEALDRGVNIRILTGNYLNITQPSALYLLKDELKMGWAFLTIRKRSCKAHRLHSFSEGRKESKIRI